MQAPKFVDMRLVRQCSDELDAVNLCIDLSQTADSELALSLGIDAGHFSRIRKGRAHLPTAKRLALMRRCGNWAPIQYEMHCAGLWDRIATMPREHDDGFSAWVAQAGRAA